MSGNQAPGTSGIAERGTGAGGLPVLRIRNEFAECEIFQYGAHISSFAPAGRGDLLWMSPLSVFREGSPIRGGIPVCFPWFGPHRTRVDLPLHGFVRTRAWSLERSAALDDGRTSALLSISEDPETLAIWPYRFRLDLEIVVGSELEVTLVAENTGGEPFRYEDCLHAYLRVGDARNCVVHGLDGVLYIDRVRGDRRALQAGELRLGAETVNAYMHSPFRCFLEDTGLERTLETETSGFADMVVWNPGEEAAMRNPEIGKAWSEFLCLEPANCLDHPVLLLPGTAHRSRLRLGVRPAKGA